MSSENASENVSVRYLCLTCGEFKPLDDYREWGDSTCENCRAHGEDGENYALRDGKVVAKNV